MKQPSVHISIHCFENKIKKPIQVINPYTLEENLNLSFKGVDPNGKGFVLSFEEAQTLIRKNPKNQECIKNYLIGKDINQGWTWKGSRMIIDFQDWPLEKAMEYKECFELVKDKVKPVRDNKKEFSSLKKVWWQFANNSLTMREKTKYLNRFIVTSRVGKYRTFTFIKNEFILPSDLIIVIASDSTSLLGILTSKFHILWSLYQSSSLGMAPRYTNTTCFETFPFPIQI